MKVSEPITIYLVLGALQAIAVDELRRAATSRSLVINFSNVAVEEMENSEVIVMPADSLLAAWRAYPRLAKRLRRLRQSQERINVAIPHRFHLVGNYLFHRIRRGELICLPDGSLTMTPMQVRPIQWRKMLLKTLAAPFLGFRYQRYDGSLHGFDGITVDCLATFYDSPFHPASNKTIRLSLGHASAVDKSTCLIIDQPLSRSLDRTGERNSVAAIRGAIATISAQYPTVIVKLHPTQKVAEIAPDNPHSLQLDPKVPVEVALSDFAPGAVIGTASTALATVKMMNADVECIVVGLNILESVRPEFRHFRDLLAQLGARFVDL